MKLKHQLFFLVAAAIIIIVEVYFLFYDEPAAPIPLEEKIQEEKAAETSVVVSKVKYEYGIPIDSFEIEGYTIQKNESLIHILMELGATGKDIVAVNMLDKEVFDARTIKAGNHYKAFFSNDSIRKLCYLVYEESVLKYTVFCFDGPFRVVQGGRNVKHRLRRGDATINSSLWDATVEANINPMLALELSEVYAWTINFFKLKKGDRFSVLYDEICIHDTVSIGVGKIYAAEFCHDKNNYYAFYFAPDSIGNYWDEKGNSLQSSFLKAPLKFSRISSRFSYARMHPILHTVRPHTGIDYVAPAGTPVVAISGGTVISRSYGKGCGNMVKIKHNDTYTSAYLHLSKFGEGIAEGKSVKQGQIIGYVGTTGLSTGSHLDFRVWEKGEPIDPLKIRATSQNSIDSADKDIYLSKVDAYMRLLKLGTDEE